VRFGVRLGVRMRKAANEARLGDCVGTVVGATLGADGGGKTAARKSFSVRGIDCSLGVAKLSCRCERLSWRASGCQAYVDDVTRLVDEADSAWLGWAISPFGKPCQGNNCCCVITSRVLTAKDMCRMPCLCPRSTVVPSSNMTYRLARQQMRVRQVDPGRSAGHDIASYRDIDHGEK
jgi:hypothetical protein